MPSDQFKDVLTNQDLKQVQKYVLNKNELERPRELSEKEKNDIATNRAVGWKFWNPIHDSTKREAVQHIQNPLYRAGFDTVVSLPSTLVPGAVTALALDMGFGGIKNKLLRKAVFAGLPLASALPSLVNIVGSYRKQKIYNDVVEEYIKNYPEGQIESMPNILKTMLAKQKTPASTKKPSRTVKSSSVKDDLDEAYNDRFTPQLIFPTVYGSLISGYMGYTGVRDFVNMDKDLNDLKERFERKKREKKEADTFLSKLRMPLFKKNLTDQDKIQQFDELFKQSAENAPLLEHQKRIIEKLEKEDQPGLILMHGLGSGKTRSSIEAYKKLGLPAEVVVPAALKGNYEKEIKKWVGKRPKNLNIVSQQEIARKGAKAENFKDKLMIVDEAHRLRNEDTKLYKALKETNPKKRILLTGTPIYNHPGDIAKLINLSAGKTILPERLPEFEKEYISTKVVFPSLAHRMLGVTPGQELGVKNKEYLRRVFNKLIDYHAGNAEGFPEVSKERVNVPMAEKQQELYKAMMKDLPWYLRAKVMAGLPPDKKELDKLIPFLSGARMISNTTAGFEKDPGKIISPKVQKAFEFLKDQIAKDPSYKGLVYSNYLQSGVDPYKKLLTDAKIPFGEFTGEINDKVRNQLVKDYNENKLKALIVSSAGGEGLDLKGTRLVQILEPHFNNEKLKQVIGRAARYKSHEALSPEKRKVLIQHYLSTLNPSYMDKVMFKKPTSTDEYLQNLADEKEKLNEEFIKLIKP